MDNKFEEFSQIFEEMDEEGKREVVSLLDKFNEKTPKESVKIKLN